jgi:hypothetical protein
MLSLLREKRVEVAKLFGALLVFAILQRWHFVPDGYFAGKYVKVLLDLAGSVLAVFAIADVILGKPTVSLEWRTETVYRPAITEILIRGKRQSINLQVKVKGESSLQRFLLRRSQRDNFIIEIRMLPAGAVKLIRQSGPDDFTVGPDRESLILGKTLIKATGAVAFADFTVKRKAAEGYEHEVTVDVTARWEPRICRLPVTLANVESGIERLVLEG